MIQAGIDQANRGELVPAEEVHKRLDEQVKRLSRGAGQRK
jgi:predicted transcriptional regulator